MKSKCLIPLLCLCFSIPAFSQSAKVNLSTPKKTFRSLVKAIKQRDLVAYKQCWSAEAVESEGMLSTLKSNPDEWDALQKIFGGPQKFPKEKPDPEDKRFKCRIKAPKAAEGGIGTISMIREGDRWLMYSW